MPSRRSQSLDKEKHRCRVCGSYGNTKHNTRCTFCGSDLSGEQGEIPRRWIVDRYVGESDGTVHLSHSASLPISTRLPIGRPIPRKTVIDCPACGSPSLWFNFEEGLFECLNLGCGRFGASLVGIIGYDNFLEVNMRGSSKIRRLFTPDYDPDKQLIGECRAEDIKDLLSKIRVLKFSNSGVTDRRVVLDKAEQRNSTRVAASMVINYWIMKSVPFEIVDKIESVRAYRIRQNKTNEVVFEYKLRDAMDDSFLEMLSKT